MFGWQRLNENQMNKDWLLNTCYFVKNSSYQLKKHLTRRLSQFNDMRICLIAFVWLRCALCTVYIVHDIMQMEKVATTPKKSVFHQIEWSIRLARVTLLQIFRRLSHNNRYTLHMCLCLSPFGGF